MAESIATHQSPVWRDEANFIIVAKLEEGRWEQLWARQKADNVFKLCCIPFFAYNMALGDEVETSDTPEKRYVISRVTNPSGHLTFRVWFKGDDWKIQEELETQAKALGCQAERSSEHLLAFDAPDVQTAQLFADRLAAKAQAGEIVYETGRQP